MTHYTCIKEHFDKTVQWLFHVGDPLSTDRELDYPECWELNKTM